MSAVRAENSIKTARQRAELSISEVARRCGVSRQAAIAWDQGRSFPRPEMAIILAAVLETTVDDLLAPPDSTDLNPRDGKTRRETSVEQIVAQCRLALAAELGVDAAQIEIKVSIAYG